MFRSRDLEQSCVRDDNNELRNCQCNDAQRRIDLGQIDCSVENQCPDDCEVCKFCLYYVVECHSQLPSESPTSILMNHTPEELVHVHIIPYFLKRP